MTAERYSISVPSEYGFTTVIVEQIILHSYDAKLEVFVVVDPKLFWRLPNSTRVIVGHGKEESTIIVADLKKKLREFQNRQNGKL